MNNIKGGANQQRGIEQLITIKSDVTIEFNRYESVFYYETLEMYTSEFVNLISYKNTVSETELNDFIIVKDSDKSCSRESTKICDTLMKIKDNALKINTEPTTTINTSGIGSYILESIILNKIYKHSLINLIKDPTKSSTSLQRNCSDVMSGGRSTGCLLHRMYLHKSSNRIRLIPVVPKEGAGIYFETDVVDHNDERDLNSNLVHRIMIPKNFKISPTVAGALLLLDKPSFVSRTISCR